jgi:hypothetical protein
MSANGKTELVFDTPDGIELYRLASFKGRIKLEAQGLRSKGRSTRALIAGEMGLSPRASHQAFIDELTKRINVLKTKILKDRLVVEERGTDWMVMSCDRSALVMLDLHNVESDVYNVHYYLAAVEGEGKPTTRHESSAAALDAAEAWVLEVR